MQMALTNPKIIATTFIVSIGYVRTPSGSSNKVCEHRSGKIHLDVSEHSRKVDGNASSIEKNSKLPKHVSLRLNNLKPGNNIYSSSARHLIAELLLSMNQHILVSGTFLLMRWGASLTQRYLRRDMQYRIGYSDNSNYRHLMLVTRQNRSAFRWHNCIRVKVSLDASHGWLHNQPKW